MPRRASALRSARWPGWNCTIAYEDAVAGAAPTDEKSGCCAAGSKMPVRRMMRFVFERALSIASTAGGVATTRVAEKAAGAASARASAAASAVREGMTGMRIPQFVGDAMRGGRCAADQYASAWSGVTTELSAQICTGIVTNLRAGISPSRDGVAQTARRVNENHRTAVFGLRFELRRREGIASAFRFGKIASSARRGRSRGRADVWVRVARIAERPDDSGTANPRVSAFKQSRRASGSPAPGARTGIPGRIRSRAAAGDRAAARSRCLRR